MEIVGWEDVVANASVVGKFSLYISDWGLTIAGYKAVKTKKGTYFAAAPCYKVEVNGEAKWLPYVSFSSKEKQDKFNAQVNGLLTPYIKVPDENF